MLKNKVPVCDLEAYLSQWWPITMVLCHAETHIQITGTRTVLVTFHYQ